MLRLVSVGILVGASALAAPGRVVRVERDRGMATVPRLCDVQPLAKEGLCVGEPGIGERVTLIDQDGGGALGEFTIETTAGAADPFVCNGATPVVYKVKGALSAGDPDAIADASRIIGLRNLPRDARNTRVVKDQLVPGGQERAELALDLDGNGTVDYMLARYPCDDANQPSATSDRRFCFDTYLARAGKLVKAHTDNIQICY